MKKILKPFDASIIPSIKTVANLTNEDLRELIVDKYVNPNHLLELAMSVCNHPIAEYLISEHGAELNCLTAGANFNNNIEFCKKYGITQQDLFVDNAPTFFNLNDFNALFNAVSADKKLVKAGTVSFNFNNLHNIEDTRFVEDIANESSVYMLYQGHLAEFSENLPPEWKQHILNQYVAYAEEHGMFFKPKVITLLQEIYTECDDVTAVDLFFESLNSAKIISPAISKEECMEGLSVKNQLKLLSDITKYKSLVIGCDHGLEDKTIINSHSCTQKHDETSLCVDLLSYSMRADITGFDALKIEHWQLLANALKGHKFKEILDHTSCLFDTKLTYSEEDGFMLAQVRTTGGVDPFVKKQCILSGIAKFAKKNILVEDGVIRAGTEGPGEQGNKLISPEYFSGKYISEYASHFSLPEEEGDSFPEVSLNPLGAASIVDQGEM